MPWQRSYPGHHRSRSSPALRRQVEASHPRLRDPRHPVWSSPRDPSRTTRRFRLLDPPWRIDRAGRRGPGGHGAARGARGDWRDSDGPAPGGRSRRARTTRNPAWTIISLHRHRRLSPDAPQLHRRIDAPNVELLLADVFSWEPETRYDAVTLAFWHSHVPPEGWEPFWAKVERALAPGGLVLFMGNASRTL